MREDLLQSAVNFLKDPKVQSSSMGKKVAFLESKGLTSEEIQEAIRRAGADGSAAPLASPAPVTATPGVGVPAGYPPTVVHHVPPPPPPALGWRDYFIMAVVIGGVGYGTAMLAKKYLGPFVSWPSQDELDEDRRRLEAEFDRTKEALEDIQKKTSALNEQVEKRAELVEDIAEKTQISLNELSQREEKRDQELKQVQEELNRVRDVIPKILDQSKNAQSDALNDLQVEIKSLKSMMANRSRAGTGDSTTLGGVSIPGTSGSIAGRPSIPSWQLAAQQQIGTKTPPASTTVPTLNGQQKEDGATGAVSQGSGDTTVPGI